MEVKNASKSQTNHSGNPDHPAGYLWLVVLSRPRAAAKTGELTASGTIEATQVTISPEFGGKVAEVSIDEGQAVKAGQVLARIEDKLLQAQLDQAKAVLAVAQANYDLIAAGPTPSSGNCR